MGTLNLNYEGGTVTMLGSGGAGSVGIGTVATNAMLTVDGTASNSTGAWSVFSDARLKKDVTDLSGSLDTLLALRGVTFEYIDPEASFGRAGERIGFIAQEVEQVMPDWVGEVDGYKQLTIQGFEALAVEALRELDAENTTLDAENAELQQRLAELEAEQALMKQLLSELMAER